jgi:tetratricopeptide (TPR) repeat protein
MLIFRVLPGDPAQLFRLGRAPVLELLAWAMAVDAGQAFGATRFAARRFSVIVGAVAAAPLALALVFWGPLLAECHLLRGFMLMASGDEAAGRAQFERAYALDPEPPENEEAASFVVECRAFELIVKDPEGALEICREGMRRFPRDPQHPHLAAAIHLRQGDLERAVAGFREALRLAEARSPEEFRRLHFASPTWGYRWPLICALADLGTDQAVEEIVSFVDTDTAEYTLATIEAKGLVRAIDPLVRRLRDGRDPELAERIRETVAALRERQLQQERQPEREQEQEPAAEPR